MKRTTKGSENGIHTHQFVVGEIYDVGQELADAFIGCGAAELHGDKPGPKETAAAEEAPEVREEVKEEEHHDDVKGEDLGDKDLDDEDLDFWGDGE